MELLAQSGSRAHTLTSYISVFKHFFSLWDWDTSVLQHRKIHLFLKSVAMNSDYTPLIKATLTIQDLERLAEACDTVHHGIVFKAAFLLSFFCLLDDLKRGSSISTAI